MPPGVAPGAMPSQMMMSPDQAVPELPVVQASQQRRAFNPPQP